ncbi:flagellin lysine-N-methylase [Hafnia sp.]|uniref:flagellin lysine-N-methylase n=1 Tax=Hafnia sp. TaxID=1873498 RepID=UPI002FC96508
MKTHKTVTPNFYTRFQCSGAECIDHCCSGWQIFIDKKTYKKYTNAHHEKIRSFAKNSLLLTRKGYNEFAMVKVNESGNCPMLNADKLCTIHAEMSPNALSMTCNTFPRLKRQYANETLLSLTMACPEVVNQVLFQPDSMLVNEHEKLIVETAIRIKQKGVNADRSQTSQLINLFCSHLIMADSPTIEDNLLAIVHLILYLQQIKYEVETNVENLDSLFLNLQNQLASGEITKQRKQISSSASMKLMLLSVFGTAIQQLRRGRNFMVQNHLNLATYLELDKEPNEAKVQEKFTVLNMQWEKVLANSCLSEEHVVKNYILYHMYNNAFPGDEMGDILRKYYLMIADYFYLKTQISMISMTRDVTQEEIMQLFGSFHMVYNHNHNLAKELNAYVDQINANDDLSCLLLLN